jgi:phage-related protein
MHVKLAPIVWLGDARDVIRSWPVKTKQRAGVVLHAFEKKTKRTTKTDIEQGKQRLKMI